MNWEYTTYNLHIWKLIKADDGKFVSIRKQDVMIVEELSDSECVIVLQDGTEIKVKSSFDAVFDCWTEKNKGS